jgi:hypothetical protein
MTYSIKNKNNYHASWHSPSFYLKCFTMHSPYLYICIVNCIMIGPEEAVPQDNEEQEAELHHLELNSGGAAGSEGLIIELPECPDHYPPRSSKASPGAFHTSLYSK